MDSGRGRLQAPEQSPLHLSYLPPEPAVYRATLDLYAGELLSEDRYEEWAQNRR